MSEHDRFIHVGMVALLVSCAIAFGLGRISVPPPPSERGYFTVYNGVVRTGNMDVMGDGSGEICIVSDPRRRDFPEMNTDASSIMDCYKTAPYLEGSK